MNNLEELFSESCICAYSTLDDNDEFVKMSQEIYDYRFGKGSCGEHELLDRSSIILGMWDDYIIEHPSLVRNRELWELAMKIESDLSDFYQRIGNL